LRLLPALLASCTLFAADGPRIVFSKSFPGSTPAFAQIRLERSGAGEYKEDPKEEDPIKFQLTQPEADEIFGLADKLGHFDRPLEANLKVANTGIKTFRYETNGEAHEVKFNYSEDPNARSLVDWFERISEVERNMIELERAVRFDKLGVQNALLRIEIMRDQKRLVAAQQFLPMLDHVANNETFLHMSRMRAAALADSIRAPK
jgi:hypothetical protein